ncbi:MAG: hypothetical protein WBL20_17095 [Sphingobium sp.]|uniref:hypothetical protein n=1 Tax=Sphingobium sp. TaxID=1912891 RepID=UPI003BB068DC
MPRKPAPGLQSVAESAASPEDAPSLLPDAPEQRREPTQQGLPPNCPVKALGKNGKLYYFLDDSGQLIEVNSQFTKGDIYSLFGRDPGMAEQLFPQYGRPVKDPSTGEVMIDEYGRTVFEIKGLDQTKAQKRLIQACSWQGIFDRNTGEHGRGAHVGRDGQIILHCGDQLLMGAMKGVGGQIRPPRYIETGIVDKAVYSAAAPLPHPADQPSTPDMANATLETLKSWRWRAPDIMPLLLLGFIGQAQIPGALPWRAHIWINAGSGSGKTTLMDFIDWHINEWRLRAASATEAGIRQTLGNDALAVLVDEFEAEAGDETKLKVLGLARISSSGDTTLKGSAEHKGQQFTARSCFLFSSILHQPLIAQDRNRITVLDALPLPDSAKEPAIVPAALRQRGSAMRRRMVEQWPRYLRTYERYKLEIQREGFSARHGDQYGTLLACADMLLFDDAPHSGDMGDINEDDGRVTRYVSMLLPIIAQAEVDGESDHVRCLRTLVTHKLPAASGMEQESVGRWIAKAMTVTAEKAYDDKAMNKLRTYGLRLVNARAPSRAAKDARWGIEREFAPRGFVYLAVASAKEHKGLGEIFDKTDWKGGVWSQSLNRVKGADVAKEGEAISRVMLAFDGKAESATLVPLNLVIEWEQGGLPPRVEG